MSNGRHTANTTTLAKSGNVSPLTQRNPEQSKQPKRVPVTEARKIWGTVKHATVAGVVGTLKVLGKVPSDAVLVKRKYKMARDNPKWVICWWFVVREEESVLRDFEKNWNLISMQTS